MDHHDPDRAGADPPPAAATPDEDQAWANVDALLRDGKKIQAIKELRQATGMDLKAAKELCEDRARRLGIPGGQKSCFVATAAFGDADAWEVRTLRTWRDETLARSPAGRALIRVYGVVGPHAAEVVGVRPRLAGLARVVLGWTARVVGGRGGSQR